IPRYRIVFLAIIFVSGGLLLKGYIHLWNISSWPTTTGKIIDYESGMHSSASHSQYGMQTTKSEKWNRVEYQYTIDGIEYVGHRISPNFKATYPYKNTEERISVFYNPKKHSEAYLLPDRYHSPIVLWTFIVMLTIFGLDFIPKP
ncbi:DUF3592 domain-containing protein, partial [Coraliomargarita sp. SDUM461003]